MSGSCAWEQREALGVGAVGGEEPQRRRLRLTPARSSTSESRTPSQWHVRHVPARDALETVDELGALHGPQVGDVEA